MRTELHYIIAALLLSIYGGQVCPFLDSLTLTQLTLPIYIALAIQFVLHRLVAQRMVAGKALKHQSASLFKWELGLFLLSGFALTLYNTLTYGFPLESGLKLVLGLAVLGFFIAIDLALERERDVTHHIAEIGDDIEPDETFMPLTRKVAGFAATTVLAILAILFLVLNKDLDWLMDARNNEVPLGMARGAILGEMAFVTGVLLGYVLNVIHAYARNLRLFLDKENGVLAKVTGGELNHRVPVSWNDEFGQMASRTNKMVEGLQLLTEHLRKTRDVTIHSLSILAETRDNETGAHIVRTQYYVKALAEQLRHHPRFAETLNDATIELLFKSAPLHDIGKVGIPDEILLKPGKHTDEEFNIMKGHAIIGERALRRAEKELPEGNDFLHLAAEIAGGHHEKWDGSGYPRALKGDDIPVSARLMAVADVYDALISKRVYKPAFSHEKARSIIVEGRGNHFDPDVVDAFLDIEPQIIAIAREHGDEYTQAA